MYFVLKITKEGSTLATGEHVDRRERLTPRRFWETMDEDLLYSGNQLDRDIVNPSTIRTIIGVGANLPMMIPDRKDDSGKFEVPKTLIFAKTDSYNKRSILA